MNVICAGDYIFADLVVSIRSDTMQEHGISAVILAILK